MILLMDSNENQLNYCDFFFLFCMLHCSLKSFLGRTYLVVCCASRSYFKTTTFTTIIIRNKLWLYVCHFYMNLLFFPIIHNQPHWTVVGSRVVKDMVIKFLMHHNNKNNILQHSSFTTTLTSTVIPYLRHTAMVWLCKNDSLWWQLVSQFS